MFKRVLAIETSCDDTSVAIVDENGFVDSMVAKNQDQEHQPFGGIVPEIASRNHSKNLIAQVEQAFAAAELGWDDIDGIAVTSRPGLIGSLLVGVVTAKTLALVKNKALIGVNHLEGHIVAPLLRDTQYQPPSEMKPPFLALTVSGGHSSIYMVEQIGRYRVLGETVDDAAGEAFDKFGKMLRLPYPGGVFVDKMSVQGDTAKFNFPKGNVKKAGYNFSFSGLKAAGQRLLNEMSPEEIESSKPDLCASYQQAIVDALMKQLKLAVADTGCDRFVITGGVSANSGLRAAAEKFASEKGLVLAIPPLRYCTDNAAMIGYAGVLGLNRGEVSAQDLGPSPRSLEGDFIV